MGCPNTLQTGCYGITGSEVLNSLSHIIYNITAEATFWSDLVLLLGIALFFKILFIIMAYYRCFRVKAIGSPRESPTNVMPGKEGKLADVQPMGSTDVSSEDMADAKIEV